MSGEVAAGGVVLPTLRARVFWLTLLDHNLLLLGSAVTRKKGLKIFGVKKYFDILSKYLSAHLVSVCCGAAVVDLEDRWGL